MLIVNLITTHYCLNKKNQTKRVLTILTSFTILLLIGAYFIRRAFDLQYIEGGLSIFLGATYFFPIKYLYQEKSKNVVSVMIFSWIHTFTVTYFAVYFSNNFIKENTNSFAFIIQNVIFLITTPLVIKFIKERFIYILNHIPKKMYYYLLVLSGLEFVILMITFLLLANNNNPIWVIIIGVLVALISMLVYSLMYVIVKNQNEIYDLEEVVYIDYLTKLKNRAALFKDLDEFIKSKNNFKIIYMDLDNFKLINDQLGHLAGDNYLIEFARSIKGCVGNDGYAYRLSGDEFACVLFKNIDNYDEKSIYLPIKNNKDFYKKFLGVSVGVAIYPDDGVIIDKLMKIADEDS
jgi:diguanylate cyclase (GGDEF)-like protein